MNRWLLATLMILALSGCAEDPCPDDIDRYSSDYIVTGVKEVVAAHQSGEVIADETTAISIDQLELWVELDYIDTYTANGKTIWQSIGSKLANLLIEPSYACSPSGHRLTTTVVGMGLISNASLGDSYPPGGSLGGIFEAEAPLGWSFLSTGEDRIEAIELISNDNPIVESLRYELRLNIPSAQISSDEATSELHRFTFTLDMSDGQSFSVDTAPVLISIDGS